jgi:hypothetical protein
MPTNYQTTDGGSLRLGLQAEGGFPDGPLEWVPASAGMEEINKPNASNLNHGIIAG